MSGRNKVWGTVAQTDAHLFSALQHAHRHGSRAVRGQKEDGDRLQAREAINGVRFLLPTYFCRSLQFDIPTCDEDHLSCGVSGSSADFSSMDRSSAALHFLNSSGNSRSNVDTNKASNSIDNARSE